MKTNETMTLHLCSFGLKYVADLDLLCCLWNLSLQSFPSQMSVIDSSRFVCILYARICWTKVPSKKNNRCKIKYVFFINENAFKFWTTMINWLISKKLTDLIFCNQGYICFCFIFVTFSLVKCQNKAWEFQNN